MDVDMERLIDEVWNSSLGRITKKESPAARCSLGDDIDLLVPQTRTLLLVEANPAVTPFIYNSSYASASRNARAIMEKLGMPADYFWKFEYWPKERAFDMLRKVINRVFTNIMGQNKEGKLDIEDVDIEHMKFTVSFKDCAECAGIIINRGICYYHAATFTGIIAALINKDMDGFETKCRAKGDDACIFLIGKKDAPEISAGMSDYLAPAKIETKINERLNSFLSGQPLRSIGNLVNIGYYQLMLTNSIINNPESLSSTSFDIGVEYGAKIAPIITDFYQEKQIDVIRKYYRQLHYLDIRTIETGANVDIVLVECAEIAAILKKKELLGFLFGELQGLVSTILNQQMVYKESSFDNGNLKVRLEPKT